MAAEPVSGSASVRLTLEADGQPSTVQHVMLPADSTVAELRNTISSKLGVARDDLSGCCRGV